MNITNDQKSFRREQVIVPQQHCKDSSSQSVRFEKKKLGFVDKIFFYRRFCPESQVSFLKNLTDWHDKTLECCCHTISHSRLKLSQSLVISTSLYSPWDPYKLCWKKKNVFFLKIFHFSICLISNKLYWIEDQLADISTRFYTSASWRWRVELLVSWLDTAVLLSGAL